MAVVIGSHEREKVIHDMRGMAREWGLTKRAGTRFITVGIATVPPGLTLRPHYHKNCGSAIYTFKAEDVVLYTRRLDEGKWTEHHLTTGDFIYIPAREVHSLKNFSDRADYKALFIYDGVNSEEEAGTTFLEG